MDIQFSCPTCGARLVLGQEFGGREVRCPKCGSTSVAPAGAPPAESIPFAQEARAPSQQASFLPDAPPQVQRPMRPCPFCGQAIDMRAQQCGFCHGWINQPAPPMYPGPYGTIPKSRVAAGLLGIFLGGLGIHRFYLGYPGIGVIQLLLGLGGCATFGVTSILSHAWGFIEGIMILAGGINNDGNGQPLAG